jgi:hypothetical protein
VIDEFAVKMDAGDGGYVSIEQGPAAVGVSSFESKKKCGRVVRADDDRPH